MLRAATPIRIGGRQFQAGRLCAADEFQCVRRLTPLVKALGEVLAAAMKAADRGAGPPGRLLPNLLTAAEPLVDALVALPEPDADFIFEKCLGVSLVLRDNGALSPVWDRSRGEPAFDSLGMVEAVRICLAVLDEACATFFSPGRLKYRRTYTDTVTYEAVQLPDELDWLYAPTLCDPPMLRFEALFDGSIGLARVAAANEALEARSENARRANAAAQAARSQR